MKRSSKILSLFFIIAMVMIIIPSSFASDVENNATDLAMNVQGTNVDSINYDGEIDFSGEIKEVSTNHDLSGKIVGSGVNVDNGISVTTDTITMKEGSSTKITGTLYGIDWDNSPYYNSDGAAELTYSYVGNDGKTYTDTFFADADDATFELDLSKLSALVTRDEPYKITLSCEDVNYYFMYDDYPDPVDITVKVVKEGGDEPVSNPALYVDIINGDDNNNGSINAPFATIQKAIASAVGGTYDIFVNNGTYTISSIISVKNLNIIGLSDKVIFDMQGKSACFDASGDFAVANITFVNGYGTGYNSAGAIKSTSTSGKTLKVNNCKFINCTGYAGAISTYYSGYAVLTVVNSTFVNCSSSSFGGAISVSSSKTANITGSSFINCKGKNGGAIYFGNSNGKSNVNYCVFINNTASSANNDIHSKGTINVDYNYWGVNDKPDNVKVSSNVEINKWVVLNINAEVSNVVVGDKIAFTFDFTKDNEGVSLEQALPELPIGLDAKLGDFDNNVLTTNGGKASANYNANVAGNEIITVNIISKVKEISFDVFDEGIIYVASNGSDITGVGSKNNPYKTLGKALTAVSGNKNVIYIFNGTYLESNLVIINKAVTVIGEDKNNVIIDATRNGRIFVIDSAGNNITIKSLTLKNGKPDYGSDEYDVAGKGGAIYIDSGNLYLDHVNIYNSTSAAGGAIASGGANAYVYIKDSTFNGNSLNQNAYDEGYFDIIGGGAIYSEGNLNIVNSTFTNNVAQTTDGENIGGAIYIGSNAIISNSTFTNNSAKNGGAIAINAYNSSKVTISNNKFTSNTASDGGAIYSSQSKLTTIANNEFENNKATVGGGAIYAYGQTTENIISNNKFYKNNAATGGALYVRYATVTLSNNIMNDNKATGKGNAIYYNSGSINNTKLIYDSFMVNAGDDVILTALLTDDSGNIITGGTVTFIIAGKEVGSGITDNDGIASYTFTTNNTLSTYNITGTFNGGSNVDVENGTLNVSKYYWFINNKGFFTLQDAIDGSVEGDVITGLSGAYLYEEIAVGSRINSIYKNVTIKADKLGDIILTGVNGRLFNVAGKNANNITSKDSSLTLINIVIRDCVANYGGAIYNDGYLTLMNCYLVNNTSTAIDASKWHGGAIMGWGDLKIYDSVFEDNHAYVGGAIFTEVLNKDESVLIKNTKFINNNAGAEGGAIYLSGFGKYYKILNCTFINNHGSAGGAIFAYANLTVEDSTFLNNTAINSGGAIYSTKKDLTLNNIYIENSSAKYGGAIYLQQNRGNTWIDGVPHPWKDIFHITNSTFVNNKALIDKDYEMSGQGGVIFIGLNTLATGFIDNCTFINSSAEDKGGVLINYMGNITVTNSKFINSTSSSDGGAIYNEGYYNEEQLAEYPGNMIIEGCLFENISANHGGAIFNSNYLSIMSLTNSTFRNIKAAGLGGAIFNKGFLDLTGNLMENVSALKANYIYNMGNIKTSYITYLNNETILVVFPDSKVVMINATVCDDMGNPISGKNIKFTINGVENATLEVIEGKASYAYTIPAEGNYTVSGYYTGSDKGDYEVKDGMIVTYTLIKSIFIGEDATIYLGDNYTAKLTDIDGNPLANKDITLIINSITYNFTTDVNGIITIPNLVIGQYNITGIFNGDNVYSKSSFNANVSVILNKNVDLNVSDIIMFYKDGTKLTAKLTDCIGNPIANETIFFIINGVTYNRTTDADGIASMAINLIPGNYNVTVYYKGSDKYNNVSKNVNITIISTIYAENLVKMFQNGTQFFANFTDIDGKPLANTNVTFNINGVFYTRETNANGTARLNINLEPGKYILTVINPANDEQKGFNITVKSLVEANDLIKYYKNASAFEAKIYDKNGVLATNKNVTFNINGVFYNKVTDENGIAKLNINLRPGKYIITTYYEGLAIGNNVEVLPTLITSDLNMNYKDGSKFNATVLDGRGNPLVNQKVTFNVNGVFYYKTTNLDGIASLNINLMQGKYIITSEWDGYQTGNNIIIA